jgi:hypothetical protein
MYSPVRDTFDSPSILCFADSALHKVTARPRRTIVFSEEVTMNIELVSSSEKEKSKKELQKAINTLIAGCEALDMELAFGVFSNSPDFLMMGTDGSLCDYQTYLNNNIAYLTTCSNFELTTLEEEIRILNRDMAVFAWAYRAEATLKTGEQDIVENAGATFVFNKANGEWKVVYYHESSSPPIRVSKEH